jgi:SAM-dependent methyltransferase
VIGRLRLGIRQRARSTLRALADARYWVGLRRLGRGRSDDYHEYLQTQLRRTLAKRSNDPGVGTRLLIDRIDAESASRDARVLCVGCRNGVELDAFRARGYASVVGIDVFSQRPDILVMDMHELAFPDDSFDIVYASHSLEHSYDVGQVAAELVRVARDGALVAVEVPLRTRASAADRVEFPDVAAVEEVFHRHVSDELLVEEQPPRTARNAQGTDVGRLVVRLKKAPSSAARPAALPHETAGHGLARRPVALACAAVTILLATLVGLPEALGDRPYDPRPVQITEKVLGLKQSGDEHDVGSRA